MAEFNAKECERLAREMAEDDIAVSGDNYNAWMDASQRLRNNAHAASSQLRAACAEVTELTVSGLAERGRSSMLADQLREAEADRDRLAAELQAVKDERDGLHRTLKAVVDFAIDECSMPTRDMLGSDAPVRVMRKLKQDRDSYANSDFERQLDEARGDRDRLAAECERLRTEAEWREAHSLCVECGPNVRIDEDGCCVSCGNGAVGTWLDGAQGFKTPAVGKQFDDMTRDHALLTASIAALTSDLAKYRALVEQMRPVYEAALRWRRCDRDLVGPCVDHRDLVEACANACDVVLDTAAPKGAEDE